MDFDNPEELAEAIDELHRLCYETGYSYERMAAYVDMDEALSFDSDEVLRATVQAHQKALQEHGFPALRRQALVAIRATQRLEPLCKRALNALLEYDATHPYVPYPSLPDTSRDQIPSSQEGVLEAFDFHAEKPLLYKLLSMSFTVMSFAHPAILNAYALTLVTSGLVPAASLPGQRDLAANETGGLTDHQRRTLCIGRALIQHKDKHGCLPGTNPDGPPFELSGDNFNSKGDFKEWAAVIAGCKVSSVEYSLRKTECWSVASQGSSQGLARTLNKIVRYTKRL